MPVAHEIDDADWIAQLRLRDPSRVTDLSQRLVRALAKSLGGRGVSASDVDDFAQESVLRILDRLDQYRGDSRFTTWAIAIAIRVAMTNLRRRKPVVDVSAAPERVDPDDPAVGPQRRELLAVLQRAIDQDLTERQRETVRLFLSGTPQVVLAERAGMTSGAFHKMMHDARMRLRLSLERAGFDGPATLQLIESGGK